MRRKDREITDRSKILEIISSCRCCRLGFNDSCSWTFSEEMLKAVCVFRLTADEISCKEHL